MAHQLMRRVLVGLLFAGVAMASCPSAKKSWRARARKSCPRESVLIEAYYGIVRSPRGAVPGAPEVGLCEGAATSGAGRAGADDRGSARGPDSLSATERLKRLKDKIVEVKHFVCDARKTVALHTRSIEAVGGEDVFVGHFRRLMNDDLDKEALDAATMCLISSYAELHSLARDLYVDCWMQAYCMYVERLCGHSDKLREAEDEFSKLSENVERLAKLGSRFAHEVSESLHLSAMILAARRDGVSLVLKAGSYVRI